MLVYINNRNRLTMLDLPDTPFANAIRSWESQYWEERLDEPVACYKANIGCTLAVYLRDSQAEFYSGLRLAPPYSARHLPWYHAGPYVGEDLYYIEHADHNSTSSTWLREHQAHLL